MSCAGNAHHEIQLCRAHKSGTILSAIALKRCSIDRNQNSGTRYQTPTQREVAESIAQSKGGRPSKEKYDYPGEVVFIAGISERKNHLVLCFF